MTSEGAPITDAKGRQSYANSAGMGPSLGKYLILTGTDNDYSVTQNASGQQFDVYFRVSDADPYVTSIFCPLGQANGCFLHDANGTPTLDATLTPEYKLLPGVLHAYKVSAAELGNFVRPGDPGKHDRDDDRDDDNEND